MIGKYEIIAIFLLIVFVLGGIYLYIEYEKHTCVDRCNNYINAYCDVFFTDDEINIDNLSDPIYTIWEDARKTD